MSPRSHTYGQRCHLAPVVELEPPEELSGIPPIKAQFFYSSLISIDKPLPVGAAAGTVDSRSGKGPLRPFSAADNIALERAWLGLASDSARRSHGLARQNRSQSPTLSRVNAEKLGTIVQFLAAKHAEKHGLEVAAFAANGCRIAHDRPDNAIPVCCLEVSIDVSAELRREFCALMRKQQHAFDRDRVVQSVMAQIRRMLASSDMSASATGQYQESNLSHGSNAGDNSAGTGTDPALSLLRVPDVGNPMITTRHTEQEPHDITGHGVGRADMAGLVTQPRPSVADDGISGKPFVRVNPEEATHLLAPTPLPVGSESTPPEDNVDRAVSAEQVSGQGRPGRDTQRQSSLMLGESWRVQDSTEIAVGMSRLHMVSLPVLQMRPIYWSPVNDMSVVLRATWFYRDTMAPVESIVANQLEAGFRELKPWTDTWTDEIKSALEVGPAGEEKLCHRLWPEAADRRFRTKDGGNMGPAISSDPFCAARCFRGEAAAEGTLENIDSYDGELMPLPETGSYANSHVIYKDSSAAFILKPSLKPSAYYGRRPVSKIMKGLTVGIPVVRGFDRAVWERINEKGASRARVERSLRVQGPAYPETSEQEACPGCKQEELRQQVTDLVLVVHGIGQKFAERVESFHFTHAINAFRRAVKAEFESPGIQSILGESRNGIMVLPVNWRHVLSFEEGGPMTEKDKAVHTPDSFGLKDIEPNSIKSVRSLISDVMFDIPFYMSHHKPKMIEGLVGEANRVYRLWCRNNPVFAESGRVHLIGHSLGSAMAIDILSKQPTMVPRLDLRVESPRLDTRHFEFDTTNLFLLGSPAGFFLLLERGGLLPRRGRLKPGADPSDAVAGDVVGDVGTFGCIAVDNVYNILAKEDPIAYLLNGTVDSVYAASLKPAYVPSTGSSLLKSVGDAMRSMTGAPVVADTAIMGSGLNKPPTRRLPSQLELEVHDFSREEVAEKKAFLLNDNGQIDFYLRSGGGPLEIQYLNMLSAHTSYWSNQDMIRMLCVEIGREPGRENALSSMRAVKSTKRPAAR